MTRRSSRHEKSKGKGVAVNSNAGQRRCSVGLGRGMAVKSDAKMGTETNGRGMAGYRSAKAGPGKAWKWHSIALM